MTDHEDERSATKSAPGAAASPLDHDPSLDASVGENSSMNEPEAASPAAADSASEAETQSEPSLAAPETESIEPAKPAPETARQRSSLPLFAAAIVAGAALAVGGAFGLRHFDGSATATAALSERIAALTARADSIESETNASMAGLRTALDTRVGAAERAASKAASEMKSALSELEKSVSARLASLVRGPGDSHDGAAGETSPSFIDLGPLQARLDAVEKKLGSIEEALAAPKADVRAQQESGSAAEGSKVQAVAIVAESLLRKLERGAPFPAELAALDNLGVGQAELAPLRPFATTGVASPRKLADQFAGLATPILAGEAPENASILDRLARDAANLVRIRRVGEVDANDADVASLVARIENALKRLDVEEAFAIWTELPSAAKAKSESWGEAAKARLDALNAARTIEADAVAALGKPKS